MNLAPNTQMPVFAMCKALYLIACGIIPLEVEKRGGRTTWIFERSQAEQYTRLWDRLYTKVADASKVGVPLSPDELKTLSDTLFGKLEDGEL